MAVELKVRVMDRLKAHMRPSPSLPTLINVLQLSVEKFRWGLAFWRFHEIPASNLCSLDVSL